MLRERKLGDFFSRLSSDELPRPAGKFIDFVKQYKIFFENICRPCIIAPSLLCKNAVAQALTFGDLSDFFRFPISASYIFINLCFVELL